MTERLVLRRPKGDDAQDIFARLTSDPQVTRYVSWPRHTTIDETRQVVAEAERQWQTSGAGTLVIADRTSGVLLGTAGLKPDADGNAELSYILARDAWGRGLTTEAVRSVLRLADSLGLIGVHACVHPDNQPSIHVLQKAGLTLRATCRAGHFPNLYPRSDVGVLDYGLDLPGVYGGTSTE